MTAWPMNHLLLKVRMYRARSAPAGNMNRNPTAHKIPCASMILCVDVRGMAEEELALELELELVEFELRGLVRSSVSGPNPTCCCKVASCAEDEGAVVPKAHMMLC